MAATFTFDPGLSRPSDIVRFRLGDDDTTGASGGSPVYTLVGALVADETINSLLATKGQSETCALLAEQFIAKYSSKPDEIDQHGVVMVSWKDRVKGWIALVKIYRGTPDPTGTGAAGTMFGIGQNVAPDFTTYL